MANFDCATGRCIRLDFIFMSAFTHTSFSREANGCHNKLMKIIACCVPHHRWFKLGLLLFLMRDVVSFLWLRVQGKRLACIALIQYHTYGTCRIQYRYSYLLVYDTPRIIFMCSEHSYSTGALFLCTTRYHDVRKCRYIESTPALLRRTISVPGTIS